MNFGFFIFISDATEFTAGVEDETIDGGTGGETAPAVVGEAVADFDAWVGEKYGAPLAGFRVERKKRGFIMLHEAFDVERAVIFGEDARAPMGLDGGSLLKKEGGFFGKFA